MGDTNNKTWELNIYQCLKDLSDLETQKLAWLGKHPTNVSSFTEVLGMLYDNFAFEDYINFYKSNYGVNNFFNLLLELDKLIVDYQEIGYKLESESGGAEKILTDPKWSRITEIALKIVAEWNNR